jgi:methyl-accepting chemotaxis protein
MKANDTPNGRSHRAETEREQAEHTAEDLRGIAATARQTVEEVRREILAASKEIGRLTDEVRVILEESRSEAARLRTEAEMVLRAARHQNEIVEEMRKTVQSLSRFSPTLHGPLS